MSSSMVIAVSVYSAWLNRGTTMIFPVCEAKIFRQTVLSRRWYANRCSVM